MNAFVGRIAGPRLSPIALVSFFCPLHIVSFSRPSLAVYLVFWGVCSFICIVCVSLNQYVDSGNLWVGLYLTLLVI